MQNYLLVFRSDMETTQLQITPEQMQAMMTPWQTWMAEMSATGNLVSPGHRLMREGKVVKPGNVVTDGPFVELKESVGGYTVIKAASLDAATELAKGCPIFQVGGTVEVREMIMGM